MTNDENSMGVVMLEEGDEITEIGSYNAKLFEKGLEAATRMIAIFDPLNSDRYKITVAKIKSKSGGEVLGIKGATSKGSLWVLVAPISLDYP